MNQIDTSGEPHWTPARERLLLLTLAVIQFTIIVDFLIIMPLEPQYARVFEINPRQFGYIVAAYGLAAGLSGIAAGFFLDRFDRKRALLWLFLGFTVGTFLCALAPTYLTLVAARFLAGAFGGVVGAVVLAIVGDVIPLERRGAAMGMVMSSFSVASILGVPLGNYLAAEFTWRIPFYAIAGVSALIFIPAAWVLPPLCGHMQHARDEHPIAKVWAVIIHPEHWKAFVFMATLTFAGFLVFPELAAYMSFNIGFTDKQLGWIYGCGGAATLFTMNWIGRWADRSGKRRVFTIVSLTTAVPILVLTNLPRVPLVVAIATSTLLFICMSGRMVPAMAMMTSVVEARYRGGFMSINSAVQQLSAGVASLASGLIVSETKTHELRYFPINGLLAIACAYCCIYLARFLKPAPEGQTVAEPVLVETV